MCWKAFNNNLVFEPYELEQFLLTWFLHCSTRRKTMVQHGVSNFRHLNSVFGTLCNNHTSNVHKSSTVWKPVTTSSLHQVFDRKHAVLDALEQNYCWSLMSWAQPCLLEQIASQTRTEITRRHPLFLHDRHQERRKYVQMPGYKDQHQFWFELPTTFATFDYRKTSSFWLQLLAQSQHLTSSSAQDGLVCSTLLSLPR